MKLKHPHLTLGVIVLGTLSLFALGHASGGAPPCHLPGTFTCYGEYTIIATYKCCNTLPTGCYARMCYNVACDGGVQNGIPTNGMPVAGGTCVPTGVCVLPGGP